MAKTRVSAPICCRQCQTVWFWIYVLKCWYAQPIYSYMTVSSRLKECWCWRLSTITLAPSKVLKVAVCQTIVVCMLLLLWQLHWLSAESAVHCSLIHCVSQGIGLSTCLVSVSYADSHFQLTTKGNYMIPLTQMPGILCVCGHSAIRVEVSAWQCQMLSKFSPVIKTQKYSF